MTVSHLNMASATLGLFWFVGSFSSDILDMLYSGAFRTMNDSCGLFYSIGLLFCEHYLTRRYVEH